MAGSCPKKAARTSGPTPRAIARLFKTVRQACDRMAEIASLPRSAPTLRYRAFDVFTALSVRHGLARSPGAEMIGVDAAAGSVSSRARCQASTRASRIGTVRDRWVLLTSADTGTARRPPDSERSARVSARASVIRRPVPAWSSANATARSCRASDDPRRSVPGGSGLSVSRVMR